MRLTSLALVPLSIGFVWLVMLNLDRQALRGCPHHAVASAPGDLLLLFILSPASTICSLACGRSSRTTSTANRPRIWSLAANLFFCFVVGMACVYAVMRLSFT